MPEPEQVPVQDLPPTPEVSEFDAELKAFRNADFDYIFVFRRKDGNAMKQEDKEFVRNNAHYATNRFTISKDETFIFAGSNYKFNDDGLEALKARFEVSDYSRTDKEIEEKKKARETKAKKKKEKGMMPRKADRDPE